MKDATKDLFNKAHKLLDEAEIMIEVNLYEAAGRNAYLAGCCAARGLIFEDFNQVINSHKRLWGDITGALHKRGVKDPTLSSFLPTVYSFKRVADYETGSSEITKERAEKAVMEAGAYVKKLLTITQEPLRKPSGPKMGM